MWIGASTRVVNEYVRTRGNNHRKLTLAKAKVTMGEIVVLILFT